MQSRVFDAPITTNDQSVGRLLSISVPVGIVFWDNQQALKPFMPELEKLAQHTAGELIIAKLKTSENPHSTTQFDVKRTPMFIGLRSGREMTRVPLWERNVELRPHIDYLLARGPKPRLHDSMRKSNKPSATPKASAVPLTITDATFEREVLLSPVPVLVDFWAPWCGPCHQIAPTIEGFAREYQGALRVAKINVDQNPHFAGMFGVQGIPTILLFKDGKIVDRLVGQLPPAQIRDRIRRIL